MPPPLGLFAWSLRSVPVPPGATSTVPGPTAVTAILSPHHWGRSSAGRAPDWQSGGSWVQVPSPPPLFLVKGPFFCGRHLCSSVGPCVLLGAPRWSTQSTGPLVNGDQITLVVAPLPGPRVAGVVGARLFQRPRLGRGVRAADHDLLDVVQLGALLVCALPMTCAPACSSQRTKSAPPPLELVRCL